MLSSFREGTLKRREGTMKMGCNGGEIWKEKKRDRIKKRRVKERKE